MFGLPISTEINKALPKKAVFEKFRPSPANRRLFDEQISRLAVVAEISPQTVNVAAGTDVAAVYVILVTLKVADCDRKNIALLSRLIDQRLVFALQYEGMVRLAAYRADRVLVSGNRPFDDWRLNLSGQDLSAVWKNLIAQIGGIDLAEGKDLDETIILSERREKLAKQIAAFEKKARNERQPRRKWELVSEIKDLKAELEGISNG